MRTDKAGADKIISVYWFAMLFIISAGIFAMVYVFYNSPFDVRTAEADALGNQIASCIFQNGKISSSWTTAKTGANLETCQTSAECQRLIGGKIVSIVDGIKGDLLPGEDLDALVKQEGVAENFECLVLQIAMQESSLQHCKDFQQNGNPLYCDGKSLEELKKSDGDEKSYGAMQINIGDNAHPQMEGKVSSISESAKYGVKNVLIQQYNENKAGKLFVQKNVVYSGWKAAIRGYNGWGASGGDKDYVENVIGQKNFIQQSFPEFCSSGKIVDASEQKNLKEECNLNFKSEFQEIQYYAQIDFYDFKTFQVSTSNGKKIISSQAIATIYDGNANLKADCEIQEIKNYERQSKCFEKRFYAVDEKNNQYAVKITSVVRKTEKNAKL